MRSTRNRRTRTARAATPTTGKTDRAERAGQARADLYDEVTRRVIAELEAGRLPWVQPWGRAPGTPAAGLPRNALTGRAYSGINILILWGAVIEGGYPSQGWLTFRQAREAGGAVRKGERGTSVVYADRFVPESERQRARGAGEEPHSVPFLKRFTVFNAAQCDGLQETLSPEPVPLPQREVVPLAEAVIAASGVPFRIGGERAFYAPGPDFVTVPPQPAFFDQINYYRTCLHELTHATGHASRLGRDLSGAFGSPGYAREELVAEMGSAFLCAALGIVPTVRHADYIASWLAVLREDNKAIVRAASQASKAADWLLARHRERGEVQTRARGSAGGMNAPETCPFASEPTAEGEQSLVPGVAPITLADRLAWRAAQPLGPAKAQRPCDLGLFDLSARNQLELFTPAPRLAAAAEPDPLPPPEPGGG